MKKISLLSLLFIACFSAYSAMTTLSGTVKGKYQGIVRVMSYQDMLSYKKVTLASSKVGQDGKYSLTIDLQSTTYVLIDFNFQQAELFLDPGLNYTVNLFPEDNARMQAYYDRPVLEIEMPGEKGINERVGKINMIYNDFLLENAAHLNNAEGKRKVNEVIPRMNSVVEGNPNVYLNDYLRYKVASLEMFFRTTSNENLAAKYLSGQPVLHGNVEYMDFFHLYFEKYLLTNNPYFPYSKTSSLINGSSSLEQIIAELKNDPVLSDTRLAEMVLLSGLKEMSVAPGFEQKRIISLLDKMTSDSRFPENRMIASNMKERILWMKPGSAVPEIILPDMNGKQHNLAEYQGKYIYLDFISLYSPSSLSEMNALADLYEDYRDRFHFVTIIVDNLLPGWTQILKDHRMSWDVYFAGENLDLIESYGATAPPLFMMIDPEGKVFRYPAPSPSEDLRGFLDSIY